MDTLILLGKSICDTWYILPSLTRTLILLYCFMGFYNFQNHSQHPPETWIQSALYM